MVGINQCQEAERLLNAIKLQEPSWLDKIRAELKILSLMFNTNSVANIGKLKNQPDTAITIIDLTEEDQGYKQTPKLSLKIIC